MLSITASGVRRAAALAALVLACPICVPGASAQAARPREYEVKAAYLFSFARFVEWPPSAGPAAQTRFQVCILGRDPFGDLLDRTIADQVVRNVPVAVSRVSRVADALGCQMVFVGEDEQTDLERTLAALSQSSALTIGDSPRFAERGGMIEFIVDASRVRFIVNRGAAESAGLELSSDLLRVAVRVLPESGSGR